jgi:hypothetical protein
MTALSRVGGRKFIAAMTTLASATFLVAFDHIDDGVYSAVVIAAVAAYIAGNVTQKAVTREAAK